MQFKITHKRYLDGLMHQVEATRDGSNHIQTEEDYIKMRRRTVGGYPCISLIAYASNLPCKESTWGANEISLGTPMASTFRRWFLSIHLFRNV